MIGARSLLRLGRGSGKLRFWKALSTASPATTPSPHTTVATVAFIGIGSGGLAMLSASRLGRLLRLRFGSGGKVRSCFGMVLDWGRRVIPFRSRAFGRNIVQILRVF